jgi:hypothetical protein
VTVGEVEVSPASPGLHAAATNTVARRIRRIALQVRPAVEHIEISAYPPGKTRQQVDG